MTTDHHHDLPLMANSSLFHIYHYVLDLNSHMDEKRFSGSIYLFLNPVLNDHENRHVFSIQEYNLQMTDMCTNLQAECEKLVESANVHTSSVCNTSEIMDDIVADIFAEEEEIKHGINDSYDKVSLDQCVDPHRPVKFILDAYDLNVINILAVEVTCTELLNAARLSIDSQTVSDSMDMYMEICQDKTRRVTTMRHTVDKWCIVAWRDEIFKYTQFPRLIRIDYTTKPEGKSLRWVKDQDNNTCVFTAAMWVNNRALFPTAEYGNLSTWQCYVSTPEGATVLMSSDNPGIVTPASTPVCSIFDNHEQVKVDNVFACDIPITSNDSLDIKTTENAKNDQDIGLPRASSSKTSQDGATTATAEDNLGHMKCNHSWVRWYHMCSSPLPPHALAIAVGFWPYEVLDDERQHTCEYSSPIVTCSHVPMCSIRFASQCVLPCRVFGPRSILAHAVRVLGGHWSRCCCAVQRLLGAFPYKRVDVLIYPACVQHLALANPNLMFLSQSLLAEDGSMDARVGHELSHSWFGLLIGARDWTEEWLSEGFATFAEDAIYAAALQMCEDEEADRGELRALIRHRVLTAEMDTTADDLQTLRPGAADDTNKSSDVMYVKNGLNPNKQFTQVHYLKGYFLLRHLSKTIGTRRFNTFLRACIEEFHGQMILSKDILRHCFNTFPELRHRGLTPEGVTTEWLDAPGLPAAIAHLTASSSNSLYRQVEEEVAKWKKIIALQRKKRSRKAKPTSFVALAADQLVLVLEELLTYPENTLHAPTLRRLNKTYNLQSQNADVRHRWCELVVKHGYTAGYQDVETFLIQDQAMGVYLYGELVLANCKVRRDLAERCFERLQEYMEAGTQSIVHSMIYGYEPT